MKKDRVQEWRKSLNILTNCIKTIRKAENLRNKLNDKITRLRTFEMSDFNLFFYCILLILLKHVISNLISIFKIRKRYLLVCKFLFKIKKIQLKVCVLSSESLFK